MSIGNRLKEERLRLGYSQEAMATLYDASKRAQLTYEKDQFSPTAKQLEILSKYGVDVLYVLTGERITPLTSDQKEVVALFEQASLENKLLAVQALKGQLSVGKTQNIQNQQNIKKNTGDINIDIK